MKSTTSDLNDLKEKFYGPIGTPKRDELEEGYESFKIGVLISEARIRKGLTQKELASKIGVSTSNIINIETSKKEIPISTLKRIIEDGLGGNLEISISV